MRALSGGTHHFKVNNLPPGTAMANEIPQKHVLYIEASDLVQESHAPALEKRLHCSVRQAFSEAAALEALSFKDRFDVIILGDISKPVNDEEPVAELSIIRKARQLDKTVPIIIFTSQNYIQLARDAGANDFLLKPAGVTALIEIIKPYLSPNFRDSREPKQTD